MTDQARLAQLASDIDNVRADSAAHLEAHRAAEVVARNSAISGAISAQPAYLRVDNNLSDLSDTQDAADALMSGGGAAHVFAALFPNGNISIRRAFAATMVAGAATVTDHDVAADEVILVIPSRGSIAAGYSTTITAGDHFDITSSSMADTNDVVALVLGAI